MATHRSKLLHPLVWIEVIVAFAPISIFLAVGLFMTPFQLLLFAMSPDVRGNPDGVVEVVGLSVFGTLAMVSLANLILAGKDPAKAFIGRKATLAFGTIGLLILCYLIVDSSTLP